MPTEDSFWFGMKIVVLSGRPQRFAADTNSSTRFSLIARRRARIQFGESDEQEKTRIGEDSGLGKGSVKIKCRWIQCETYQLRHRQVSATFRQ